MPYLRPWHEKTREGSPFSKFCEQYCLRVKYFEGTMIRLGALLVTLLQERTMAAKWFNEDTAQVMLFFPSNDVFVASYNMLPSIFWGVEHS